jgi:hypothetical protein
MIRIALTAAAFFLASGCAAPVKAPPQAPPTTSYGDLGCQPMLVGCVDPFYGAPPGEAYTPEFNVSSSNTSDLFLNVLLGN